MMSVSKTEGKEKDRDRQRDWKSMKIEKFTGEN